MMHESDESFDAAVVDPVDACAQVAIHLFSYITIGLLPLNSLVMVRAVDLYEQPGRYAVWVDVNSPN